MKKTYGLAFALALGLAACDDSGSNTTPSDNDEEKLGELSFNLVGADTSGRQYRLRDATFQINGYSYVPGPFPSADGGYSPPFSETVSTETDPDAPVISLKVVEGSYDISLVSPQWYLERYVEGVWTRVEQAVLLSSIYQYAYVYDGGVTTVAFRFGVDGELIDFRAGQLQIAIEIEQPGDPAPDAGFFGGLGGLIGGIGGIAGLGGTMGGFGGVDAGSPGAGAL